MAAQVGVFGEVGAVPGARGTDVAADVMPGQIIRVDAGVLQCPPRHAQRDPLLRVHRHRLARRDAEERGVEKGGAGEESAAVVDALEPVAARAREQVAHGPAAVLRKGTQRLVPRRQQLPITFGTIDIARGFHRHPDDDHRIVRIHRVSPH